MRLRARWRRLRPNISALPYSVTMQCTCPRVVTTPAPGFRLAVILDTPFLVRLPGGRAGGRQVNALVQFHDVLPTILDVLGWGNDTGAMHGRSFRRVLEGDGDSHRSAIIVGYHAAHDRCVRDQTWSYIRRPGDEPDELYDLEGDPRETRNLVDEHPEEARRLASAFGPYFFRGRVAEVKGIQGRYEMGSAAVG